MMCCASIYVTVILCWAGRSDNAAGILGSIVPFFRSIQPVDKAIEALHCYIIRSTLLVCLRCPLLYWDLSALCGLSVPTDLLHEDWTLCRALSASQSTPTFAFSALSAARRNGESESTNTRRSLRYELVKYCAKRSARTIPGVWSARSPFSCFLLLLVDFCVATATFLHCSTLQMFSLPQQNSRD